MMKRKLCNLLVLCFVLGFLVLGNSKIVRAEEELLSMDFYLPMWGEPDSSDIFEVPEDGTVKLNISIEDTGTILGKMDFVIKKRDSNLEYTQVIKTITGVTSDQDIKDMDIDLSEGAYIIEYLLYNDMDGELSNTSVNVKVDITLNDPPAFPAPKNITKLTTQTLTLFNDIKEKYDTVILGGETTELVLPFTTKQAGGLLGQIYETDNSYQMLTAKIYRDKECTDPIGEGVTLENGDELGRLSVTLPKTGTYYIKFILTGDNVQYEYNNFKIRLLSVGSSTKTISVNKDYIAYQDKSVSTFKINVPKNGLVTIMTGALTNYDQGDYNIQLLDKNKKKISKVTNVKDTEFQDGTYGYALKYYVLKKGTYYVRADSYYNYFVIKYKYSERTDQSGKTKTSAKVLKPGGASAKGYILNSDAVKSADWYKINVNTNASQINIDYKSDGAIKYILYDAKGKQLYSKTLSEGYYEYWIYRDYAFDKGIYYLKIYKADKNSSVAYTINVK